MINAAIDCMERGWVPDPLIRFGIRRLLRERLASLQRAGDGGQQQLLSVLQQGPLAVHTAAANEQHYELPPAFFERVLGPRLKYSSCYWPDGVENLSAAEEAMFRLTCQHAGLSDGLSVLELGCGWGSLTLWMAEHYPRSRIVAMSNSHPQREWIQARCRERRLRNVEVNTCDINTFQPESRFDRIVSVEMFEHVRNYRALFQRLHGWLQPSGQLFVHVFSHQRFAYLFETEGDDDWMGRHFFTGGTMPSHRLLPQLAEEFELVEDWRINGCHYQRTLEAWLRLQDAHKDEIMPVLQAAYGAEATRWFHRWRIFFMACAELFGFRHGEEWGVSHYRFSRR
jgi:cyclopropane-fatty-acyl-phospholipid synthase